MKKLLLILVLVLFTGCNDKEEKLIANKVNLNDAVIEDKMIDNVKITGVSIIYDSGITTYRANFKSDNSKFVNKIRLVFKSNDYVLSTLEGYVNKDLIENTEIVLTSDVDLTNASLVEYIFE